MLRKRALIYFSPVAINHKSIPMIINRSFDIILPVVISDQSDIDNFQRGHMSATFWGPRGVLNSIRVAMLRWYSPISISTMSKLGGRLVPLFLLF